MRILTSEGPTLYSQTYLCAGPGRSIRDRVLELTRFATQGLPATLAGLLCTADLQGRDPDTDRLCGETLASRLAERLPARDIGVVLAGDFFAGAGEDNKLGASGDVRSVWKAFASHFRWVVGVAGNHDTFGSEKFAETNIHFLDGQVVELDGLRLAGLAGIVGKEGRRWRRSPENYLKEVRRLLNQRPDILITHEAPCGADADLRGNQELAACLTQVRREMVVISGHCHWPRCLSSAGPAVQLLNVDARAILLIDPERTHEKDGCP